MQFLEPLIAAVLDNMPLLAEQQEMVAAELKMNSWVLATAGQSLPDERSCA